MAALEGRARNRRLLLHGGPNRTEMHAVEVHTVGEEVRLPILGKSRGRGSTDHTSMAAASTTGTPERSAAGEEELAVQAVGPPDSWKKFFHT